MDTGTPKEIYVLPDLSIVQADNFQIVCTSDCTEQYGNSEYESW